MPTAIPIGSRLVGSNQPVYVIAEIGINHNGDLDVAKKLIETAKLAGCDAVKFQKRTPDLCVPKEQRDLKRETPWGILTYLEYRHRVEFGHAQYAEIDRYCRHLGIDWFASCWDEPSVDFIEQFNPVCHKIASASLTDEGLIRKLNATGRPIILSTGMSTMDEIERAVSWIDRDRLILCHTTSTYPCKPDELNLRAIRKLEEKFQVPVGYSGHETGLQATYAAVSLGACVIERHITLDRAMWGSDQAASVEPAGLIRLVRDIRVIERAMGDGIKRVYKSEEGSRAKLRRSQPVPAETIKLHDAMSRNATLRDRHKGERCFILACGPSIKKQDLRPLANETCIAVSNFFVHEHYDTIRPRYHCIAGFHAPITEEAWKTWMGEMLEKTHDAELLMSLKDLDRNSPLMGDRRVNFLGFGMGSTLDSMQAQGVDLTRPQPWPNCVTIMALYAAIYMGFSEINLLGCDHDWLLHLNTSTHFYDEKQHALNRAGYSEWHANTFDDYCRDYVNIWAQYKALKNVASDRGIVIQNATAGGVLDVFPRVTLESIVRSAHSLAA